MKFRTRELYKALCQPAETDTSTTSHIDNADAEDGLDGSLQLVAKQAWHSAAHAYQQYYKTIRSRLPISLRTFADYLKIDGLWVGGMATTPISPVRLINNGIIELNLYCHGELDLNVLRYYDVQNCSVKQIELVEDLPTVPTIVASEIYFEPDDAKLFTHGILLSSGHSIEITAKEFSRKLVYGSLEDLKTKEPLFFARFLALRGLRHLQVTSTLNDFFS